MSFARQSNGTFTVSSLISFFAQIKQISSRKQVIQEV